MNIRFSSKKNTLEHLWIKKCPVCNSVNNLYLPFYVSDQFWEDFWSYALTRELGQFYCSNCSNYIQITYPLIFDVSQLQLVIYVVPEGDNANIENDFKNHLNEIYKYLSDDVAKDIQKKPYTFVDSWGGFRALLKCLQGQEPSDRDQEPLLVFEEIGPKFSSLEGYVYGDLFFYYPDQHRVRNIVKGFREAAENHKIDEEHETAYRILLEYVKTLGCTDQWLAQELGVTALRLQKFEEAKMWFDKAVQLQHKWLAPTLSFLHIGPTAREDGETQDKLLPHAIPVASLGSVTTYKHVVTKLSPPEKDYGRWYFPKLQSSIIPQKHYSIEKMITAYGVVLGELECSFDAYVGKGTFSAGVALQDLRKEAINCLEYVYSTGLGALEEQFWREYILRRWQIPPNFIEIAQCADSEQRRDVSKKVGNAIGQQERKLKELSEAEKRSEDAFFLRKSRSVLIYLAEKFIHNCSLEEQEMLERVKRQSQVDALFGAGAAEVVKVRVIPWVDRGISCKLGDP